MHAYQLGAAAALQKLALQGSPHIQGVKLKTDVEAPDKAPESPVLPPPPHSTSGTLLNPKVAFAAKKELPHLR